MPLLTLVECIAEYTERPLLSLTCSDIGVKPETIEENPIKWFKAAESWGAIMLIDEADIYMEERRVQDIERNHLVAGFLRALEYYKGILFLTTNRVGTFDEAFMSRIHIQIHYPEFEDEERDRVWGSFFQKLEEDRETTMRITQSARDYVQSEELRALKWNGRQIRNGEHYPDSRRLPKRECLIQIDASSFPGRRRARRVAQPKGQGGPGPDQAGPHQDDGADVEGVSGLSWESPQGRSEQESRDNGQQVRRVRQGDRAYGQALDRSDFPCGVLGNSNTHKFVHRQVDTL